MSRSSSVAAYVRRVLLLSALATAGVGVQALAQEQEQQESPEGEALETVTVTGSRISQPNLTAISPVTAVTSEEFKLQGTTRVEDLVNNLPQAFADFGGSLSNGATGAATVNLRGLGSQRTLVLINGRRLMPGDPTQNGNAAPDLNQIPSALVERLEVLTGGASAVYGADAVAGVVNFIMNDKFDGLRFDAQYNLNQHDNDNDDIAARVQARNFRLPDSNVTDGYTKDFTFMAGVNTEDRRGNATVYVGYRELDPITQDQRDFSACSLASSAAGVPNGQFTCGGSGTTAPARFLTSDGDFTIGANNQLVPFTAANQFNFAPTNYYQRPNERKTAGLFAHYDVSDATRVYTEFMFMDDRTLAQIAPSGAFLGSGVGTPPFFGRYLVNCNNPYLSASMVQEFCINEGLTLNDDTLIDIGRRNVEGGSRISDLKHTSFRALVGAKGDLAEGWTYDAYGLYGTTNYNQVYLNDFSLTRLGRALTAVRSPADPNNIVCRVNADTDASNDDPNCVPYNIFQNGGVTPEALAYLQVPGFQDGATTQTVVSASVSGDLTRNNVKTPWSDTGLGVAVGVEYRQEESDLRADAGFQANDLLGQGAPTLNTSGSFDVSELFMEARLPIATDKPFAKLLSAEVGYRYSDYSLGFSTDTYKFGADWSPVDALRLRGSFQRAVRAPNIQELFLQPRVQLNGSTDPCASAALGTAPEASLTECARSGVTAAQYGNILANPAEQYNGLVGGNPNLDPESADTLSFGFVFQPEFLNGFSLAADYFNIQVDDIIGQIGQDFILTSCLAGDLSYCDEVNRAPNGSLWLGSAGFVNDPIINTGSLETSGVDLEANYRLTFGESGHQLSINLIGTLVDELVVQPLTGGPDYDCAGLYGPVCQTPTPEWRHKLRLTYRSPLNFDVSVSWRYIAATKLDATSSDPDLARGVRATDRELGARGYLDLAGTYEWKGIRARLGINNLLDKDPPLLGQSNCIPTYCNGNTFPQVYDTLGRYIFVGLTADFARD
jgi:outer membrane receptor protein involved in Fe transport